MDDQPLGTPELQGNTSSMSAINSFPQNELSDRIGGYVFCFFKRYFKIAF